MGFQTLVNHTTKSKFKLLSYRQATNELTYIRQLAHITCPPAPFQWGPNLYIITMCIKKHVFTGS